MTDSTRPRLVQALLEKKSRSHNWGVWSQRAVASGRAGALDVFRKEFHDFKKGLGSNGEHVG